MIDDGNRVIPKVPDSKCGWCSIAVENVFNRVTPDQALGTDGRLLASREDEVVI